MTMFFLVFTVWHLKRRTPRAAPEGLEVDVFVTCYDEPLEILRRTAIGARDIRYPHRTYMLDDGKRDEVEEMCRELEIGYIRREGNEHAKAGNLNNALKVTDGEFILQLDADHVPLPHILDRLLGFLDDPKVAFVQSPQDFYNTDSFTHDVNENGKRMWEEQRIFFSLIQPGKDFWNAAFFCGSCGVVRRSALEELGGFSVHTITEDMETSLRLHARGWKSVYYAESLAYGLAPGSAAAFHVQRLRWGQGSMQILRKFNPLTHPGLTLGQRICYFASVTSYLDGVQKLMLYGAPLIFFLTGVFPIAVDNREFLVRFVPYLLLSVLMFELLARGTGYLWIAERYNMAKFWTYVRAVSGYFARGKLKFNVTPKGAGHVPFRTYAPHVVLMTITVVSVAWMAIANLTGLVRYDVPGWGERPALLLNLAWAAWNFAMAAYVVRLSLNLRQQREDHRFADRFPIRVQSLGSGGRRGREHVGLTQDLNGTGMKFRSVEPVPEGHRIRARLPLATGEVIVQGKVVHQRRVGRGRSGLYTHGVQFEDVELPVRDAIELHCTQHAVPIWQLQYRNAFELFARTQQWFRNSRGERRSRVNHVAVVTVHKEARGATAHPRFAMMDELSGSGVRLVMDEPLEPLTHLSIGVPGTGFHTAGRVAYSRALETSVGVRFAIGVRRIREMSNERKVRFGMKSVRTLKRASAVVAMIAAAGLASATASEAQLAPVIHGGTEIDTEGFQIFVLGAGITRAGLGLHPSVAVVGYHLRDSYAGGPTVSQNAVAPMVGLRQQWQTGAVSGHVGYLFTDGDNPFPGSPSGGDDGVLTSLQANYWSPAGINAQAIASYNWGADYIWTNLRGTQRLGPAVEVASPAFAVGAEAQFQGTLEQEVGYRAFQAGAVAEVHLSPALRLIGVAGGKTDNRDLSPEVFPYFKVEFVAFP
jgi:cellulose synthase (UDP-forming)